MKAGDHQNPILLNLEDDSVGKSAHSGTTSSAMNDGELQRMFGDCVHRFFDGQREAVPSCGRMLSYQSRACANSASASGSQTTGSVTVS